MNLTENLKESEKNKKCDINDKNLTALFKIGDAFTILLILHISKF